MVSQKGPIQRIYNQEKPSGCSGNRNPLRSPTVQRPIEYFGNFFTDDLYMKIMKRESKKNILLLPLRAEQIATKDLVFIF